MPPKENPIPWALGEVTSPCLQLPVRAVVGACIPYIQGANRFQNLSLYLPHTQETQALVGTPADAIPQIGRSPGRPHILVYVHGGAWRDPELTSASIEPTAAFAFRDFKQSSPITAVASINYTISKYPTHPTLPYDPIKDNHSDLSREGVHPQHVSDLLHAFALLRTLGLTDGSYILSGHSAGACLMFQAIFQSPERYGLGYLPEAPGPAAMLGLNGLYDLVGLVYDLGNAHAHLRDDYEMFLSNTFGPDKERWPAASPSRFDPEEIAARVLHGRAPPLVVLDESPDDQLVPMNQRQKLEANLDRVKGLRAVRGRRCTGSHAAAWEQGDMIWENLTDLFTMLAETGASGDLEKR